MLDGQLMTVPQVAERLQVVPETIRRWIRSKEIEAVNLGARAGYRISAGAIERFLQSRKDEA